MCIFKEYSDFFGAARTGAHSVRILDSPIIDHVLTILLAMFITYYSKIPLELTIIVCYILGILCHYLFGVPSNAIRYFNISCD
jgi:hypothetical protein